jgi:gas vesicle protein
MRVNSKRKEISSMKQKELVAGVACGLMVGVVAGAVAALLLAPASGFETRRKLRYERDHAVDVARRKARRAMARLRRTAPADAGDEEEVAFSGA